MIFREITLQEAKNRAAGYRVAIHRSSENLEKIWPDGLFGQRRSPLKKKNDGTSEQQEALRIHRELVREYHRFLDRLAALPQIRPYMACWMIDFHGDETPLWAVQGREPNSNEELTKTIAGLVGQISNDVRDFIFEMNLRLTDSGSGTTGWDMGCPCEDGRITTVLEALYANKTLREYFDAETLDVRVRPYGPMFVDIIFVDEAEKLLSN